MPKNDKKASKFLSLLLRHKPEKLNLTLDEQGYISVAVLLRALKDNGWHSFTRQDLDRVVETNDKKRFAYSEDGQRIRASQGHSIKVDLGLQPIEPPEYLYHGTVNKFLNDIKETGLLSQSRQHVHLSFDRETAITVGARRGKPVILVIRAGDMHRSGHSFYRSANGVWLADQVPSAYIEWDNLIYPS